MPSPFRLILAGIMLASWLFAFPARAQKIQPPALPSRAVGWLKSWDDKVNGFFSGDKSFIQDKSGAKDWLYRIEEKGRRVARSTTTQEIKQLGLKIAQENESVFREIWLETKGFGGAIWTKAKIIGGSIFREISGFLLDKIN
ncbi:MAG: hypothetical protein V1856_03220 [Candidatus Liptonbacteria bacterium]